ncbi:MAG: hypothetical protein AB2A00_23970 [Myxococcota bacterium]
MRAVLKVLERVFAVLGFVGVASVALLHQTSEGATTPCSALAFHARKHLAPASKEVVDACLGAKGEGGLGGMLVDLGLAVTGQSREKVARRVQERLDEQLRATLLSTGQARCSIILLEGVVGRANGGPRQLAQDLADGHKADCRGEERR